MVKETVTMFDGTQKEIEIKFIGTLTADMILDNHLKINNINQKTGEIDLKGSSLLLIRGSFLKKGITDVNPDEIEVEDANRIYKKYYEKILTLTLQGMGGNPN